MSATPGSVTPHLPFAGTRLAPGRFRELVELNVALDAIEPDAARRCAQTELLRRVAALVPDGPAAVARELPGIAAEAMRPYGWLWNGFYVSEDDALTRLHLGHACGPPVCTPLERDGGPLSSGMCFDGILLGQTLAAYDVKAWPGYVSCDAASGLKTVSGIVVPVRDAAGVPLAVWDLDATQRIQPSDVRLLDVLLAALSRTLPIAREDLRPDA